MRETLVRCDDGEMRRVALGKAREKLRVVEHLPSPSLDYGGRGDARDDCDSLPDPIFLLVAGALGAQDYPAREIRSVCNFAPGSGADIVVRYYSDKLAKLAGKPVIVENRPGAQGLVATEYVARSKPDGYTILITPASSTLATAPHIFKHVPFDPLKDFAPVTTINSLAFVLAVDAAKPIRTIDELIAGLRAKPNHGFY
ncbi:MAG: hypothetical protein E6H77_02000, partial [Betaproteobacteria bacterium]